MPQKYSPEIWLGGMLHDEAFCQNGTKTLLILPAGEDCAPLKVPYGTRDAFTGALYGTREWNWAFTGAHVNAQSAPVNAKNTKFVIRNRQATVGKPGIWVTGLRQTRDSITIPSVETGG